MYEMEFFAGYSVVFTVDFECLKGFMGCSFESNTNINTASQCSRSLWLRLFKAAGVQAQHYPL